MLIFYFNSFIQNHLHAFKEGPLTSTRYMVWENSHRYADPINKAIYDESRLFKLRYKLKWCILWQAFARLSAVYGGTYMLNKPECKVTSISASTQHDENTQNGSSKLLTTVPNSQTFCRLSLMRVEKHMESLLKGRQQNARRLFVILHICLKRYICRKLVSHMYMASVSKIFEPMSR